MREFVKTVVLAVTLVLLVTTCGFGQVRHGPPVVPVRHGPPVVQEFPLAELFRNARVREHDEGTPAPPPKPQPQPVGRKVGERFQAHGGYWYEWDGTVGRWCTECNGMDYPTFVRSRTGTTVTQYGPAQGFR